MCTGLAVSFVVCRRTNCFEFSLRRSLFGAGAVMQNKPFYVIMLQPISGFCALSSCIPTGNCASVTGVFLLFFRQQPETTFEQCSFVFRIPRRHGVDGNFLLRSLHVLTLRVCSTTLVSVLCLRFNSTATGHFCGKK